jgi:RNA polymerase sigma factor (TIGR02999 family)
MRQILVDHARKHTAEKGGGEFEKMQLEESIVIQSNEKSFELLALDEALEELEKFDSQKSKIVELRYFGGLSVAEAAEGLGVSKITVERHWLAAKAWLSDKLKAEN